MIKNSKNVAMYYYGRGALSQINDHLTNKFSSAYSVALFVDHYFQDSDKFNFIDLGENGVKYYVNTNEEITTDLVDNYVLQLKKINPTIDCIVSIGGGSVLDLGKAVANLMTNPGNAADYQGWDLVRNKGVYKVGVPTLSGTGAEASRTCVMMNFEKNLKLGMNSEHTIYDQLILDPDLTSSVPRDQYFYTGMDTYIHCIESLAGKFRHSLADSFSHQALNLCRKVFLSSDMQSLENREHLMTASYLGGAALANSFVGIVHPFSAGLSVVLNIHHCEANCIVMSVMDEFYPDETSEFLEMVKAQNINIKRGVCSELSDKDFDRLYDSTIIHERPLINALGENFKNILTEEKVKELFKRM